MLRMITIVTWNGNDLREAGRRLFISGTSQALGSLKIHTHSRSRKRKELPQWNEVLAHCHARHNRIPASHGLIDGPMGQATLS